ncbi:hypothetical protein GCM10020254_18310 [Streptomyces goshikiensis]
MAGTALPVKKITHNTTVFGAYSVNNNQSDSTAGDPRPDSDSVLGNLPPESASFVGREGELAHLDDLLRDRRLITLTGVGGVGKTRLALRAVTSGRQARRDGVWWVELSPLRDPGLLVATVAHAVGLADHSARSLDEELCAWMADKELLLVLDTCEHLISACRHLVGELLQSAPGLTVLITSREPLDSPASRWSRSGHCPATAPTAMPSPSSASGPSPPPRSSRTSSATPDAPPSPPTCAAGWTASRSPWSWRGARLRLWTLEQTAQRLGARFDVLTDLRTPLLPRHQTMRTAVGWSHELCEPLERLLWARLSVFAGDFDVAAARAVCSGGPLPASRVERVLAGLVAKSVVRRSEERGAGARYAMLDTIREFGHDWLTELGEVRTVADRHAHWYAALSQAADRSWLGPAQVDWYRRMTAEHAQLRTAPGAPARRGSDGGAGDGRGPVVPLVLVRARPRGPGLPGARDGGGPAHGRRVHPGALDARPDRAAPGGHGGRPAARRGVHPRGGPAGGPGAGSCARPICTRWR